MPMSFSLPPASNRVSTMGTKPVADWHQVRTLSQGSEQRHESPRHFRNDSQNVYTMASRHEEAESKETGHGVSPALYETSLYDCKCPEDLKSFVNYGVPLCFYPQQQSSNSLYVSRFPSNISPSDLLQPVKVYKDTTRSLSMTGNKMSFDSSYQPSFSVSKKNENVPTWRLSDASSKQLVGNLTDLDTSTHFIAIDKGSMMQIMSLDAWYSFRRDLNPQNEGCISSDVAERKRRAAIREEQNAELNFMKKRLEKEGGDKDDLDFKLSIFKKTTQEKVSQLADTLYAEDAGLLLQQKKRLKTLIKSRRNAVRRDDEDPGDSALNLTHIKRAAVDWDWEDDGKASDDEDEFTLVDDVMDSHDLPRPDFNESDSDEVLTKCGQQVTSALESLREQTAEDELAQFSDDDGEEEEDGKKEDKDIKSKKSDLSTGSEPLTGNENDPINQKHAEIKESSSLVPSSTVVQNNDSKSTCVQRNPPVLEDSQRLRTENIKQRVIRTLSLNGGRMPTKKFIQSFNITSNKTELFKLIRKTINEVCEVQTDYENGETIKVLELRSQFRHG